MLFTSNLEVLANVFAGLTHGHKAVGRILASVDDLINERPGKSVTTVRHRLGANGDTDFDRASLDLSSNVLDSFQAGTAEAVGGVCRSGVGETSSKGCGADVVSGLSIRDLFHVRKIICSLAGGETYIAEADVLDHLGVDSTLTDNLFENFEDNAIEMCVLETALLSLGQRGTGGQGDDDIIGVLRGAVKRKSVTELGANAGKPECLHSIKRACARGDVAENGAQSFGGHDEGVFGYLGEVKGTKVRMEVRSRCRRRSARLNTISL